MTVEGLSTLTRPEEKHIRITPLYDAIQIFTLANKAYIIYILRSRRPSDLAIVKREKTKKLCK